VEVEKGKISASLAEDRRIIWQELFVAPKESTKQNVPREEASSSEPPWRVTVQRMQVKEVAADFLDFSRLDPIRVTLGKVQVSLSTSLEISPHTMQAVVEGLSAGLYDIALRPESHTEPMLQVSAVETSGGSFNLQERKVSVEQLNVRGGLAKASLDEKGVIDWLKLDRAEVPRRKGHPTERPQ